MYSCHICSLWYLNSENSVLPSHLVVAWVIVIINGQQNKNKPRHNFGKGESVTLCFSMAFTMYSCSNSIGLNLLDVRSSFIQVSVFMSHSNERSWPSVKKRSSGRGTDWSGRGQRQRRRCFLWTRKWTHWQPTLTTSTTASQTVRPTSCRWRKPRWDRLKADLRIEFSAKMSE